MVGRSYLKRPYIYMNEIKIGDVFASENWDGETPEEYTNVGFMYFDRDVNALCILKINGGWDYLPEYLNDNCWPHEVVGNVVSSPEILSNSPYLKEQAKKVL